MMVNQNSLKPIGHIFNLMTNINYEPSTEEFEGDTGLGPTGETEPQDC